MNAPRTVIVVLDHIVYVMSNLNVKEGDTVFPISRGRITDGVYGHQYFDVNKHVLDEPHIIEDLNHSDQEKSHEVRTNYGYGPRETYYKIVSSTQYSPDDLYIIKDGEGQMIIQ